MARDNFAESVRCYLDPHTDQPHFFERNVSVQEVLDVLRKPLEEIKGRRNSVIAIGQTRGGRYLRVIYSPDDDGVGIFVVTAYDLPDKQLQALRRRLRRRPI